MQNSVSMQGGVCAGPGKAHWKTVTVLGFILCLAASSSHCGDLAGPELTASRLSPAMSGSLVEPEQQKRVAQSIEGPKINIAEQARKLAASDIANTGNGQANGINVTQSGIGNLVSATQTGNGNSLDLRQGGDGNNAWLSQQGGNRLTLEQVGIGHRADIQQINGGPAITIRQAGGESFIKATQY